MEDLEFLKDYLDEKTFIIDNFETYPLFLKNFLLNNNLINLVKNEYIKFRKNQKETDHYGDAFNCKELGDVISLINAREFNILSFHMSRLTNEDCLLFKNNFGKLSKKFMLERINNLGKYSITDEEIELIKNCLDDSCLENKNIGSFTNFSTLQSDLYNEYYKDWGGKIISRQLTKNNEGLQNKINSISFPYLLIFKSKIKEQTIKEIILENIAKGNISKIEDKLIYLNNENSELVDMIQL